MFLEQMLLCFYTMFLSIYVILESISVAGETQTFKFEPKKQNYNFFFYLKEKLYAGRICVSARYLFSAVAAWFLLKESIDCLLCLILPELINNVYNCKHFHNFDYKNAIYATAIFLSCWSRMVYRIFGDRRKQSVSAV